MEINTGVRMQCTTQRADAQMPRLSEEKVETREEALIGKKAFQLKSGSTEHPPLTVLLQFYCQLRILS
jgi:hypothetical protein